MISLADARRIALAAQGFGRPRPARRATIAQLKRTVEQLGLLQLDYVNVLVPAHYLVPFSRLGPYDRKALDELVYVRRELTEQPAHEASIVPTARWALFRHRADNFDRRTQALARFIARNAAYLEEVLGHVRARGPLRPEALPDPTAAKKVPGTWSWSMPKAALEAHLHRGTLAVASRADDMARSYDLAERVLDAAHVGRVIDADEAARELVRLAARAHGIGTLHDIADYYRLPIRVARQRLAELVDAKELETVKVDGWKDAAYLDASAPAPRPIERAALLSPFDPVVWFRPRAARLFGFDYRIEIYTPKAQRRWGYYVLPFLLHDRLVARVDLKADRRARQLLVLAAHVERGTKPGDVVDALRAELEVLRGWLGLDVVKVERTGNLAKHLR
jgi:uncharacterized protein YcaQ